MFLSLFPGGDDGSYSPSERRRGRRSRSPSAGRDHSPPHMYPHSPYGTMYGPPGPMMAGHPPQMMPSPYMYPMASPQMVYTSPMQGMVSPMAVMTPAAQSTPQGVIQVQGQGQPILATTPATPTAPQGTPTTGATATNQNAQNLSQSQPNVTTANDSAVSSKNISMSRPSSRAGADYSRQISLLLSELDAAKDLNKKVGGESKILKRYTSNGDLFHYSNCYSF